MHRTVLSAQVSFQHILFSNIDVCFPVQTLNKFQTEAHSATKIKRITFLGYLVPLPILIMSIKMVIIRSKTTARIFFAGESN
jgi:hypothetical protein